MGKLTLSVDERVVEQAKRYAAKHETSVSDLVERYLRLLTAPPPRERKLPPVLKRLRGMLKGQIFEMEDYYRYLVRKYK